MEPKLLGRCEWCRDEVWTDYDRLESSGYLWHEGCADDCLMFLEDGKRFKVEIRTEDHED